MTKNQAILRTIELIEKHIEPLQSGWTFNWTSKKKAMGTCSYRDKEIKLSSELFDAMTDEEIENTIRHEIAHAVAYLKYNATGHGKIWKMVAREIGANPSRTGSVTHTKKCPMPKYAMVAPDGTVAKTYYRKPNKSTFAKLHRVYLRGKREETIGKMAIVPFEANMMGLIPLETKMKIEIFSAGKVYDNFNTIQEALLFASELIYGFDVCVDDDLFLHCKEGSRSELF